MIHNRLLFTNMRINNVFSWFLNLGGEQGILKLDGVAPLIADPSDIVWKRARWLGYLG